MLIFVNILTPPPFSIAHIDQKYSYLFIKNAIASPLELFSDLLQQFLQVTRFIHSSAVSCFFFALLYLL